MEGDAIVDVRREYPEDFAAQMLDPRGLADEAATAVASGEVLRSQRSAVGHFDVDTIVVLGDPGHLTRAIDRDP